MCQINWIKIVLQILVLGCTYQYRILLDPLTSICVPQWCQLSKLLYNTVAEVLANLINADKRIKGIQIGDHDIKIVNFIDNTTIFLRDITWGTFKKYIRSRFPSFEPPSPLLRFRAPKACSLWLELTLSPSISVL